MVIGYENCIDIALRAGIRIHIVVPSRSGFNQTAAQQVNSLIPSGQGIARPVLNIKLQTRPSSSMSIVI
jgi:hypothetical protein